MSHNELQIPARVQVVEIVRSRYADNQRPESWDLRKEGVDEVKLIDGQVLKVYSDGGQTPPQPGWVIMVTGGESSTGYRWTLYGVPKRANHLQ